MTEIKNYCIFLESSDRDSLKQANENIRGMITDDGLNPDYACICFNTINKPVAYNDNNEPTEFETYNFLTAVVLLI